MFRFDSKIFEPQTLVEPSQTEPLLEVQGCPIMEANFQVVIRENDGDLISSEVLPSTLRCVMGRDEDMELLRESLVQGIVQGQITQGVIVLVCDVLVCEAAY